jgi:DNA-binding transcriptional LysR family regulator
VDLRQLEYFVAVAETGSFTAAADRLGVGQPTVSSGIRRLEQTLDSELIARTAQGAVPTAAGSALLPAARRTLRAAAEARDLVSAHNAGLEGTVRFGSLDLTDRVGFPALLAAFRREHPAVSAQVLHIGAGAASLIEHVRHGRLDCAISATLRQPPPGVRFEPIFSSEYCIHAAVGHPRLRPEGVTAAQLRGEAFVGSPAGSPERADLDRLLSLLRIDPPVPVEVDRLATMFDLVGQGELVALMPRSVARMHPPGVRALPLLGAQLPEVRTVAVMPAGRPLGPAAATLLERAVAGFAAAART